MSELIGLQEFIEETMKQIKEAGRKTDCDIYMSEPPQGVSVIGHRQVFKGDAQSLKPIFCANFELNLSATKSVVEAAGTKRKLNVGVDSGGLLGALMPRLKADGGQEKAQDTETSSHTGTTQRVTFSLPYTF
jgi:hypothetical protein